MALNPDEDEVTKMKMEKTVLTERKWKWLEWRKQLGEWESESDRNGEDNIEDTKSSGKEKTLSTSKPWPSTYWERWSESSIADLASLHWFLIMINNC